VATSTMLNIFLERFGEAINLWKRERPVDNCCNGYITLATDPL
jgi:hypothetical protein